MKKTSPIGIFDSGVGGLTIAHAIHHLLPNEDLVYVGDTAHTPWGDKSELAIQTYCQKITHFLLKQNCKLILIACNTASATASKLITRSLNNKAIGVNVIDPVIQYVQKTYFNQKIGLIGTKQTIYSNTYQNKIKEFNRNIQISALATPLLCPLVEENLPLSHPLPRLILEEYLSHPSLEKIKALILGCTHYPLLKPIIETIHQNTVEIISSEKIISNTIKHQLQQKDLLNNYPGSKKTFYISDHNNFFQEIANTFFQNKIKLTTLSL